MSIHSPWFLLGLLFIAGAVGFYASRRPRPSALGAESVRGNYLAGVNFLINDQHDKALEAFLRASELDGDAVETQFALGSLYRRRGEVDRAIRIHQKILARPVLEPQQREQASYALATDYLRAGLLDRAEDLLREISQAGINRMAATRDLIRIHEVEQNWESAIELHTQLARVGKPRQEVALLHYWCELADTARRQGKLDEAASLLRDSRMKQQGFPRGALVRAAIALEQGDAGLAARLLTEVLLADPAMALEVLPQWVRAAQELGEEGRSLVASVLEARPAAWKEFAFAAVMADTLDHPELERLFRRMLESDPNLSGFVRALGRDPTDLKPAEVRDLGKVLRRLAKGTTRYRCAECGFASSAHFWQCPGCKTWDSLRPVTRFDFVAGLEGPKAPSH
ncbi:MAG: tetratricopeptide repeat protein [Steroidobacteraceae bacterium]